MTVTKFAALKFLCSHSEKSTVKGMSEKLKRRGTEPKLWTIIIFFFQYLLLFALIYWSHNFNILALLN